MALSGAPPRGMLCAMIGGSRRPAERMGHLAVATALVVGLQVAGDDPRAAQARVLVGAGDIATCDSRADSATARIIEQTAGTVFTLGDNAYPVGSLELFRRCYDPTWGRFKRRTRPAPGNHDYATPNAEGYFDYFGTAAGRRGQGYYRYQLGSWNIIVLNSNCSAVGGCYPGSRQARWLRGVLELHPAACTLAMWHAPRFNSGPHRDAPRMGWFWELLHRSGAEVVLNGHSHHYERFAPQDPAGSLDRQGGIRQFVVGTGGAALYAFTHVKPLSRVRIVSHGVLKLRLREGSYAWRFIPADRDSRADAGSAECHTTSLASSTPSPSPVGRSSLTPVRQ